MIKRELDDANEAWLDRLDNILFHGHERYPRGKKTKDEPAAVLSLDMRRPVITIPERRLNYQFMAAEAYWILSGDNRVVGVAPWNKHIAQFSDDGETFFGAYGPRIQAQLGYVVDKLMEDADTRQATLTIWRESPPATKDYPCTVAMVFNQVVANDQERLDLTVFMRSSDACLGIPYDVFTFSMVAHQVCARLNGRRGAQGNNEVLRPGELRLMMASSHLYEPNFKEAEDILSRYGWDGEYGDVAAPSAPQPSPQELYTSERALLERLMALRDTRPGDPLRWWEHHAAG